MTDEMWVDGDGEMTGITMGLAIVIEATDSALGVELENACLDMRFGKRGVGWHKVGQFLIWRDGNAALKPSLKGTLMFCGSRGDNFVKGHGLHGLSTDFEGSFDL